MSDPTARKRYTIAVDFDGVIHSYRSPWQDHHIIPDPPIPGVIVWLNAMVAYFDVVVFTTRGATLAGREAVAAYIEQHGGPAGLPVTHEKPPALVYIDDRAWRFEGRYPSVQEIHRAHPWRSAEPVTNA